jgi:hypothetical protein
MRLIFISIFFPQAETETERGIGTRTVFDGMRRLTPIIPSRKWSLMLTINYHSIYWRNKDFHHAIPQPADRFFIAVNSNIHFPLKHCILMPIFLLFMCTFIMFLHNKPTNNKFSNRILFGKNLLFALK